jgi:gliding motility-associated-like protein
MLSKYILAAALLILTGFSSLSSTAAKPLNTLPDSTLPFFGIDLPILVFSDFFSPNGDGNNDTFYILNLEYYPGNRLRVFNRNGDKVYEASPYLNDWNGYANSNQPIISDKLPEGVYFYSFEDGNENDYNGKITLKR